jgi:hypothetical protein
MDDRVSLAASQAASHELKTANARERKRQSRLGIKEREVLWGVS